MSRFYASIQGNRGQATRMGTPRSGISGHVRGWDVGIKVLGFDRDGSDHFRVYLTSGSNGNERQRLIGTFGKMENGKPGEVAP